MTDKDFQNLWNTYQLALGANNFTLADFLVRVAVEYCFIQGLKNQNPIDHLANPTSHRIPQTIDIDTEAQRLRDTLCMLQRQNYHEPEFEFTVFRETLKRIFSLGVQISRKKTAFFQHHLPG